MGTAVCAWSDPEAKLLLEKYDEYVDHVGPMKTFKNKKSMWEKISSDILENLGSLKTGAQCENRYKTVRKRKGWIDTHPDKTVSRLSKDSSPKRMRKAGGMRNPTDSENSLSKSLEIGDIVEADVRRGVGQVTFSMDQSLDEDDKRDTRKRIRQTLSSVLMQIHREKEEARERRHQEKMELLKMLFQ